MAFSFATALYVLAGAFALGVTLWALGTSLVAKDIGTGHRLMGMTSAALMPLAALVYGVGTHLGVPGSSWALVALPVFGLATTWCNSLTIARQGITWRLLHFPVLVFNALLVGVYSCRAIQELLGVDVGTPAAALTHAHAVVQTFVGHPTALDNPIWLHLPIVLPMACTFHIGHRFATFVCALFASGFTALYVMTMPFSFERVSSYRAHPGDLPEASSIRDLGVSVPWADAMLSVAQRDSWRQSIRELGVTHIALPARPELFADEALMLQVHAELKWAREESLEVVACALPPKHRLLRPATTVAELASDMAQLHWLLAEKLSPDLLVLFGGPFEDLLPYLAGGGTLEQWMEAIRKAAADVARANPDVRVAVSVASRAPHAEELFRMLVADDSPVHGVGLIFSPGPHDAVDLAADLGSAVRWCQRIPGARPIRILPVRGGVHRCGGELGQWNFLLRVLAGLDGTGRIHSATVQGLVDRNDANGLITADGRRRWAFTRLRRRNQAMRPGEPR